MLMKQTDKQRQLIFPFSEICNSSRHTDPNPASSGGASKYNSSLVCREESSDFLGERPAQQQTGYPSSKEINESLERAKYIVDKAVKNKKVRH